VRLIHFNLYSPKLAEYKAKKAGARHAKKHLPASPDLVTVKLIGNEPVFDPEANPAHARLQLEAAGDERLPAWRAELGTVEKTLTKYPSRWALRAGFTLLLATEFAGISQLLSSQGMDNPSRSLVAAAGSCILFYLFYKAQEA